MLASVKLFGLFNLDVGHRIKADSMSGGGLLLRAKNQKVHGDFSGCQLMRNLQNIHAQGRG